MSRLFLILSLFIFLTLAPTTDASHSRRVLGEAITAAKDLKNISISPTTQGPGMLLPDHPLYFIDEIKQNVRLLFAATPEKRAALYDRIAGERMAELRLMLYRGNEKGVETALRGVAASVQSSARALREAKMSGERTEELAKTINDSIKDKQKSLDILEAQSDGSIKAQVKATQYVLHETKIAVEDHLNEADLANEVADDLHRIIAKRVATTSETLEELELEIAELEYQASEAAKLALSRREEALKEAIAVKNDALRKEQERLLAQEKKKQETILKVQQQAIEQAKKAVEQAHEAAKKYEDTQKQVAELKQQAMAE